MKIYGLPSYCSGDVDLVGITREEVTRVNTEIASLRAEIDVWEQVAKLTSDGWGFSLRCVTYTERPWICEMINWKKGIYVCNDITPAEAVQGALRLVTEASHE